MRVIDLSEDGQLLQRDISYLGGSFNWFEMLKLRGIGSSKFIYDSGIEGFDQLKEIATASDYVSLELLKEGLVIRFKKQNDFKACLLRYDAVKEISVVSQKVKVRYRGRERIVHQADVEVQLATTEFRLKLHPAYYDAGIEFLKKQPLNKCCRFILLPEVLDESTLDIGWIASVIHALS